MSEAPSHKRLVKAAAAWLRRRGFTVVATEVAGSGEVPDAIGFANGWGGWREVTLIECKASRQDFLSDRRKRYRIDPALGMAGHRYYLGTEEVFKDDEAPAGWGILRPAAYGGGLTEERKPVTFEARNTEAEIDLLLSLLRRLGSHGVSGVSIRGYKFRSKNTAGLYLAEGQDSVDHQEGES